MCTVKNLSGKEKRVVVHLYNDTEIVSEWFTDESDKLENKVNSTIKEEQEIANLMKKYRFNNNDIKYWLISRKKEDDVVYITDHAFQRMKERHGWNKKTAIRMMKKVYDDGLTLKDVKGKTASWIFETICSNDSKSDEIRIYGDYVYIFNKKTLLTSYRIPGKAALTKCVQR